jgi:hypothetical protein
MKIFSLHHDRLIDPISFPDRAMTELALQGAMLLSGIECTASGIAHCLLEQHRITPSTYQVRALMPRKKLSTNLAETLELKRFMACLGGLSHVLEAPLDKQTGAHLQIAAVTFIPTEMTNLSGFRDVVRIDRVFLRLCLHWAVIPLTVAGRSRELHSDGLIMCSITDSHPCFRMDLAIHRRYSAIKRYDAINCLG